MLGKQGNESRIVFLQLRKHRERFLSILRCRLLQKGRYGSGENECLLRKQIREDMNKLGWSLVLRAKLAVTFHFYPEHPNIPELPKLVKYLLDILCSEICRDDRQVEYLACSCFRPSGTDQVSSKSKESVSVEVERLAHILRMVRIFMWLLRNHEFRDFADDRLDSSRLLGETPDEIEELWPDPETAQGLNLPPDRVDGWHGMIRNWNQQKLLMMNRLGACDWPDGRKDPLFKILRACLDLNPFAFEMHELPSKSGARKYRTRLGVKLKKLKSTFPAFGRILAPMDLDIQVTPGGSRLSKDLDNIILDVSNVFAEELLEKGSYLHGYRIYVTMDQDHGRTKDSIFFKLLPAYEISDFERFFDRTLGLGAEWLRDIVFQ